MSPFARNEAAEEIETCLRSFYRREPDGAHLTLPDTLPQIQHSVRTNFCDIGFQLAPDGRRCIVISCLDNLLKGAAGQAVQNMNLMYGWDEDGGTGMKYVVKLGGAALENAETLHGCAQAIVDLVRDGHQVAVVHGGGVR